jgi:hypothetical protein
MPNKPLENEYSDEGGGASGENLKEYTSSKQFGLTSSATSQVS